MKWRVWIFVGGLLLSGIMAGPVGGAFPGRPGEGIRLSDDTTISPLIEGSYTYDSNVLLLEDNEEDDFFYDLVGAATLLKQNDTISMSLRAWFQMRRYEEFIDNDADTYQETFDFLYGDPRDVKVVLSQRYGKVADYEFTQPTIHAANQGGQTVLRLIETRTRRVERELNDLGAGVSHETDKTEMALAVSYASVAFDEEDSLYDWDESQLELDFGYKATDKSSLTLAGELGSHTTDNDLNDTMFLKARAGWRTKPSYKMSVNIGVGAQRYDADAAGSEDDDLDETVLAYDIRMAWAATEKMDFQAFGRNEILPTSAFTDNTKQVNQGSLGLIYRITETFRTTLGVSYRADDYNRPIGDVDAFEELLGGQARLIYEPRRKFLEVYAKLRYEEFTSNIQDDYEQLRATLGLNLKY